MSTECPNSEKFFRNLSCTCFPCHEGIAEADFNCLFCYCPLYALGKDCGGSFEITADGIKDCSGCVIPHCAENYDYITHQVCRLIEKVQEDMKKEDFSSEKEIR